MRIWSILTPSLWKLPKQFLKDARINFLFLFCWLSWPCLQYTAKYYSWHVTGWLDICIVVLCNVWKMTEIVSAWKETLQLSWKSHIDIIRKHFKVHYNVTSKEMPSKLLIATHLVLLFHITVHYPLCGGGGRVKQKNNIQTSERAMRIVDKCTYR